LLNVVRGLINDVDSAMESLVHVDKIFKHPITIQGIGVGNLAHGQRGTHTSQASSFPSAAVRIAASASSRLTQKDEVLF
jgi:hypothetical protein